MSTIGRDGPIAVRVGVATLLGSAAAIVVGVLFDSTFSPACGWIVGAMVYLLWTWSTIGRMDAARTATHATREDPTRLVTEAIVLTASVASLLGVGYLFMAASGKFGADLAAAVGAGSVAAAWFVVHTIFALRYALLYYRGTDGGIDFNQSWHLLTEISLTYRSPSA
jgi:uncharacterized membrane protein